MHEDLPALLLWVQEGEARKDLPHPFALTYLDFHRRRGRFPRERDRRLPRTRARREQRVLRLSDEELPGGQRQAPSASCGHETAADLERFRQDLQQRVQAQRTGGLVLFQPASAVLDYLDRYGDGRCGHPVARDDGGLAVAVVDRTNNVVEYFFATVKQGLRRTDMGRDMQDQSEQAALAANLRHPDYVRIVCGTQHQLPRAFAGSDRPKVTGPTRLQCNNRDAALRRRNRAWADDANQCTPPNPASYPRMSPELQVSNRILTR